MPFLGKFSTLCFTTIIIGCYSCLQKEAKLNVDLAPMNKKQTGQDKPIDATVETFSFEDFSGAYELVEGHTDISDNSLSKDFKGAIIIEKLNDTDFGFYAANKVKKLTPIGDFGVIRRVEEKYNVLGFCSPPQSNDESEGRFSKGIYLSNEIIIKKEGDFLGIIRYGSNFRSRQLYRKKEPETDFFISLIKTLETARLDYVEYLKAYQKALNHDKGKLEVSFFFENNKWTTKHIHHEFNTHYTHSYSYQDPSQNIQVLKEDSVFMARF